VTGGGGHDGAAASLVPLSEFEARRLARQITEALAVAWDLVARAYAGRVWEPLGYPSWDAYCRAEFAAARLRLPAEERQEVVGSLREAGMSARAIASATGASKSQISRDSAGVPNGTPGESRPVTGLDGKQYSPHSAPSITPTEAGDGPIDAEIVNDGHDGRASSGAVGASRPGGRPRRALTEQAKDAGWDLRKAIERIERLTADDRYPRHADQMRTLLRGHVIYATDTGARLLAGMSENTIPNEEGGASC